MLKTLSVPVKTSVNWERAVSGHVNIVLIVTSRLEYLQTCVWTVGLVNVPFSTLIWIYAARWLRISSGRLPSGFLERLINFLGFDSAKDTPRYSPAAFQVDFLGCLSNSESWALLANVSKCPAIGTRSS